MKTLCLILLSGAALLAQRGTGELRLAVTDEAGAPCECPGTLVGEATAFRATFSSDAAGRAVVKNLPLGVYRLSIDRAGFAPLSRLVEVRTEVPIDLPLTLSVSPIRTEIVVADSDTLIDPHRTGTVYFLGSEALRERKSSSPGRSVLELVDEQPGFLLEANGVLHPRGSEYDVQYVVDGIPITDNRSPAFAPELDADDLESMKVMTAGYPAEYGRKLGGIVEVVTQRDSRPGFHGKAVASGGSFTTAAGYLLGQYGWGRNTFALSADAARTDRYLDPPVEENFTNKGTSQGASARFERDLTDRDRIRFSLRRTRTSFLVPDERVQQAAGQRQDRNNRETMGQVTYQKILSPNLLANMRAMVRDFSANLWSNTLATPIFAEQQRGFREGYVNGSLSEHHGRHEIKAGAEASFTALNESFGYRIIAYRLNGVSIFDRDTPRTFAFNGSRQGREQALYVQDQIRLGPFTFSAGLRWDHYRLLVDENGVSPRLGVAWHIAPAGLVLRATYDRIVQTPPMENLLLSSSEAARAISDQAVFLPVRMPRGNFYEAGFTKSLFRRVRLNGNYFRRDIAHFTDDDLFLNTGVSFPIEFQRASIYGFESKLEIPEWGRFSGFVSYSNMIGRARFPLAGGLFLEDGSAALLASHDQFPITQDQRNTVRARFRVQAHPRVWFALGALYGSGLPVEVDSANPTALAAQYGSDVVSRVNLDRGRVRPSLSVDASAAFTMWKAEHRSVRLQADLSNLTNRLNVIDFAGLFSGTALAAPRSYALRLETTF